MSRLQAREGRLSFFLVVLMLLSIIWSMELAGWVQGLYVAEWTALGGLALGFVLTRLGWPRAMCHILGVAIGASLVLVVMGGSVGPDLSWRDGIETVAYHFDGWLRVVTSRQSSTDAVTFVLLITVLGWWVGYACAWMVFGAHKVWQALAFTGAAMLLVVYGSPPEVAPFFVLYLLCALLLVVRLHIYAQEKSWTGRHARYDRDITLFFLRDGGLLVLAVLAVVWTVPLLSSSTTLSDLWARFEGPWRAVGDEWNRAFSGVRGHGRGYENVPFGQQLALGGPINLGDDIVMWVETDGARYWRGAVFDHYDGAGWENTDTEVAVVAADGDLPVEGLYEKREVVEQTVVPNWSGLGQVFYVGEPYSVDVPVDIRFGYAGAPGNDAANPWSRPASVSLIKTRVPVNVNRAYRVFSSTSVADKASLRAAGYDYPAWVTQRYLQLPPALPARVGDLAERISEGQENPYAKGVAIRDYLRRTIQYREDVAAPPGGRDGVDYLLFTSRAGYCNYYASAMVVMARSVGIPARLAVGYMGGELDEGTGHYVVRERNTHAWVEVYFPGLGWVEFEPTATEEPIARPDFGVEQTSAEPRDGRVESGTELGPQRFREELTREVIPPSSPSTAALGTVPALAGLTLLASAVVGFGVLLLRRRSKRDRSGIHGTYYASMCTYGRLLGVKGELYQTPYEYALALGRQIPQGARQVERITALYVQERFARRVESPRHQREAEEAWRRLRSLLAYEIVRRIPRKVRNYCWRW